MKKFIMRIQGLLKHPLARGSAIVFIGSVFGNFAAYIYHLIVGRMLGPDKYGELAALFSLFYLFNVPSGVLQTVLTRYFASFRVGKEFGRAKMLSVHVMRRLLLVLLVGALCLVPIIGIVARFLHIEHPSALFFIYLTSSIGLLTVVQISLLQGFQQFTSSMIAANIGAALRVIGGVVGALFGVVETVFAGLITSILGFITYVIPLRRIYASPQRPANVSKKEMVAFAAPSLLTILGMTSLYSTDIILAKHYLPALEAGYYAALSVLGKIIFFASSNISYVLFPVIAERMSLHATSHKLVYAAFFGIAVLSVSITAGYFLFPRLVLHVLFGPSYYPASPYLGWFGVFLTVYSLSQLLVTTFLGRGNTKVWLFVDGAAVLQILAMIWFHSSIPSFLSVNISVTLGLLICLLLYYRYEIKQKTS